MKDENISYHLSDLIDIPLVQVLLEQFSAITGITSAILDLDGIILASSGWQDICTKFHRVCEQTVKHCKQSDDYIKQHLNQGTCFAYKCKNGLIDCAAAIIINNQHIGTVFTGQFFHEPPDEVFFRRLAKMHGFDEASYMEALHRVPVISKSRAESIILFFSRFAQLLTSMGHNRMHHLEAMARAIKEGEELLRISEERFFKAFNSSPNLMSISTIDEGRYIDVNLSFLNITGYHYEEVIGRTSIEMNIWKNPQERTDITQMLIKNKKVSNLEVEFLIKTGESRTGLISEELIEIGGKNYILAVVNDITELKQLQKEMGRLDRLNLVGEMAASIAHEIRNPMTTARGFLQLLGGKMECIQYKEYFDLIIEELDRANYIITEFLSLARNKSIDLKVQNLNTIIRALLPLIKADAIASDKYVKTILEDIPNLLLDEKEIRQLILNLVRNGLEAMSPGGYLTISTFKDRRNVVLSIKDQGKGIESEVLDKIGTPFFTTKENGTGLGLAVCYSIAARHNSTIKIHTGPKGTTFLVKFNLDRLH